LAIEEKGSFKINVSVLGLGIIGEQEILAMAIALEEEDARIYGDFSDGS